MVDDELNKIETLPYETDKKCDIQEHAGCTYDDQNTADFVVKAKK